MRYNYNYRNEAGEYAPKVLLVDDYGVLAADLVPAMRDADGVVGFYDVVRKIFCAPSIEGVQLLCGYGLENFNE